MNYEFVKYDDTLTLIESGARFESICARYFENQSLHSAFYRDRIERTGIPTSKPIDLLVKMAVATKSDYRDSLQHEAFHALQARPFISDYSSGSTDACVLRFSAVSEELAEQEITETVFRRADMGAGDRFVCLEVGAPEIYDFYFRAARNLGAVQTTYIKVTPDYSASFEPLLRLDPTVI